jgi:hypothetical protein
MKLFFSVVVIFFTNSLFAQPIINSFSPTSGPVDAVITINGTNFNTTPALNIVYFGGVKAAVTSASATLLTVTVPYGASLQPISITTGGLTAYSSRQFTVTFTGGGFINETSFAPKVDSSVSLYPYTVCAADIDGDGNADLITANKDSDNISVLRNTTVNGSISFDYRLNFLCTFEPYTAITTDLNGDGKLDIAVASFNGFSVYRNTSTPGNISFDTRIDYTSNIMGFYRDITCGDFDGDGKTDIALAENGGGPSPYQVLSIFRNSTTGIAISFAPKITFTSPSINASFGSFCLRAVDLDGDNKTDIAFTYRNNSASTIRNISSPGNIAFTATPEIILPTSSSARGLAIGDMNSDGKPDIIIADHFTDSLTILKNTSVLGNITFGPNVNLGMTGSPRSLAINDLDGDGKPELVSVNVYFTGPLRPALTIFKNTTAGDSIILANPVFFSPIYGAWSIALTDLNRDGKADIATANAGGGPKVSILKNRVGNTFTLCPNGGTTITSSLSGASYQWQMSTDSILFSNIFDNANYTGTNSAALQLSNIPSSWYGRQYRCVLASSNSNVVTITFVNYWIGAVSSNWENPANWSCGSVPDLNTDVIINSGNVLLNSNTTIRSLRLNPSASLTVGTGFTLTIKH